MEEKYNKNEKRKGAVFLLLSILWMAVIFMFSAQTGEVSHKQSGFLTDIVRRLIPFELSESEMDTVTFIIRKLAHFTEYAILGALYFETVYYLVMYKKLMKKLYYKTVLLATALCMMYAVSDEFHQYFTDGRSPSVRDVIIDTLGGFAGSMLVMLIICVAAKKKREEKIK